MITSVLSHFALSSCEEICDTFGKSFRCGNSSAKTTETDKTHTRTAITAATILPLILIKTSLKKKSDICILRNLSKTVSLCQSIEINRELIHQCANCLHFFRLYSLVPPIGRVSVS